MAKKEIRVSIGEKILVDIEDLHEFQGDLKELFEADYLGLKNQILDKGIAFCPHVWKEKGKLWLLDGHQRKRVLTKMRVEGYKVPKFPAIEVHAENFKKAKELVLAAASQFGRVTNDGLYGFMHEAGLSMNEMGFYRFPEVDMPSFEACYFQPTETVSFEAKKSWDGMPEYDHEDKTAFRSIIVHFKNQENVDKFAELVGQNITDKTRMLWYPEIEIERASDKRYGNKKT